MDRFFNLLYTVPYYQGFIERISIYYWANISKKDPTSTMMRLFPGENVINPNYVIYGNNTINGRYHIFLIHLIFFKNPIIIMPL